MNKRTVDELFEENMQLRHELGEWRQSSKLWAQTSEKMRLRAGRMEAENEDLKTEIENLGYHIGELVDALDVMDE